MTRKALFVISWALVALAVVAWPPPAHASIRKGPYLQNLTQSSIVVRWETAAPRKGVVQYGLTRDLGSTARQTRASTQHEVRLTGLLPDTLYYYRAISGSDTSAGAAFHTPVRPGRNFRFLVYGDHRTNPAAHRGVVDRMKLASPPGGFVLDTGDLTTDGSVDAYQSFFDAAGGLISHAPLFPCVGNHDTGDMKNWETYLSLPNNERWYTFRYGNVTFHNLDLYSPYTPGSPQYDWFLGELRADSADVTVRHIVVTFHEPPYTTNQKHASNRTVRQQICPLLERFGVELSFQGHVHAYEHSFVDGVHYIVSGGGGAPLYDSWGAAEPWTVYREACYEFVQVDVRGDTLAVKAVKPGGEIIDPFVIVREESAAPGTGRSGAGR
jgi:hypothetical protein